MVTSEPVVDHLPPRSEHDPARERSHRLRRSVVRLPALVSPVDLPEDAPGRVELIVAPALEDRDEPAVDELPPPAAAGSVAAMGSGWVAVAVVAAVLVLGFVLGMLAFR